MKFFNDTFSIEFAVFIVFIIFVGLLSRIALMFRHSYIELLLKLLKSLREKYPLRYKEFGLGPLTWVFPPQQIEGTKFFDKLTDMHDPEIIQLISQAKSKYIISKKILRISILLLFASLPFIIWGIYHIVRYDFIN